MKSKKLNFFLCVFSYFTITTIGTSLLGMKQFQSFGIQPIFNTSIHQVSDPTLKDIIPSDISFMIADIKYKENDLKIIEFGDGLFAGLKVLDHMCGEGKVWTSLWDYLSQYKLPIWYVGSYRTNPNTVAWSHFIKKGGYYASSLATLKLNAQFKKTLKKSVPFNPGDIKTYKGIIVIKRYNPPASFLNKFKQEHPDFIILCDATTKAASDKNLTNLLFNTDSLKTFRPTCAIYPREYTSDLAEKIANDLKCKWFVIKPVNSGRGNGILMVKKQNLDATLKQILKAYHNHLPYDNNHPIKLNNPLTHQYWRYERHSHFLVEEYVESKHITVQDKPYDATMRVIFTLAYDQQKIHLTFLDAYWKKPIKAIGEKGTFREKHLSKHQPNYYQSIGFEVSKEDLDGTYALMRECLPKIYWNMLTAHYQEELNQ